MKCGLIKFILYFCMCRRDFLVLEAATTTTNLPTLEKLNTICSSMHLLGFRIRSVRQASFSTIAQVHAENLFRIVEHRSKKRSQAPCTGICDCRCDSDGRCTLPSSLQYNNSQMMEINAKLTIGTWPSQLAEQSHRD
jgi:hypothetical protein